MECRDYGTSPESGSLIGDPQATGWWGEWGSEQHGRKGKHIA
jgi:hypothetical protein